MIGDVRFGSKADSCSAATHVRFTPNSDRESGHPQEFMSALPPKADICVHGLRLLRYGGKYVVGRNGATDALKRKIANWFNVYGIFNPHQDTRTNQDLPWLGFVAKPRRDVRYRSDGGVIETSLKANGAERRKSVRNTDAKAELMSQPTPFLSQCFNRHAHLKRRLHSL